MTPAIVAASVNVTLLRSLPKKRCAASATPRMANDPRNQHASQTRIDLRNAAGETGKPRGKTAAGWIALCRSGDHTDRIRAFAYGSSIAGQRRNLGYAPQCVGASAAILSVR